MRRGPVVIIAIALVGAWLLVLRPAVDSPERRIAAYLSATATGDEQRALDAWILFEGGIHPKPALVDQRAKLTHELATDRVGMRYTIDSIDWWRTCCEPAPIDDPGNAGLARVRVTAVDTFGRAQLLVFEVFVKDLAWWGDAGGQTVHDWRLYEVHRDGTPCIFPSTAYGCQR